MNKNEFPEILTIQLKRGTKALLEQRLTATDLGVPKSGEPIYETDTERLKIGNGIDTYSDLKYVSGQDTRFIINDPKTKQILLYDEALDKWVNKDLTDNNSIIYLSSLGLSINGYNNAEFGQMPVKDRNTGIKWITPISMSELDNKVQQAAEYATKAGNYSITAGNNAARASQAAQTAEAMNLETKNLLENKFWWGTLSEYNELEQINDGTIYFIKPSN